MRQVIERNRVDWIREHPDADPEDLIRVIEDSRRAWMVEAEKPTELSDIMLEYFNELDNRKNQRTLLTGIDALDEMTGGVCPGTLTAVGARPSTGKSAFCLQVAVRVASAGAKVLFFSLEMSDSQNMDRLMLMHAHGFSQKELRSGNLRPEQWDAIRDAAKRIEELNGNLAFMQTRPMSPVNTATHSFPYGSSFMQRILCSPIYEVRLLVMAWPRLSITNTPLSVPIYVSPLY